MKRLINERLEERAAIQRLEAALQKPKPRDPWTGAAQQGAEALRQKTIDQLREWEQDAFEASQLKSEYAPLGKVSKKLTDLRKTLQLLKPNEIEKELEKRRKTEAKLAKEFVLEESLAARCIQEAGAAAAAKPALPVLTGVYTSPHGHTELTQTGLLVGGTVKYDVSPEHPRGGTSTLTGSFDGRTYNFDWRDTYMRYGSGHLTVLPDGTGLKGWWEDKTANPPKRENWWLYRK